MKVCSDCRFVLLCAIAFRPTPGYADPPDDSADGRFVEEGGVEPEVCSSFVHFVCSVCRGNGTSSGEKKKFTDSHSLSPCLCAFTLGWSPMDASPRATRRAWSRWWRTRTPLLTSSATTATAPPRPPSTKTPYSTGSSPRTQGEHARTHTVSFTRTCTCLSLI